MALTNVWTRDSNGEWVRTNAVQMDRDYNETVPADKGHFRCYSCFQYVTFVKSTGLQVSHFRHSSKYKDKDCEDRSFNAGAAYAATTMENMEMPMRICIDRGSLTAFVGLLPIRTEELAKCISENLRVEILGNRGAASIFRIDATRVAPNMTTWLPIPTESISKLKVEFSPRKAKPNVWSGIVSEIPITGAVFDAKSGRRIPDKGDVVVQRDYYVLLSKQKYLSSLYQDVFVTRVSVNDATWDVYRVRAGRFSKEASDFFFEKLQVRLTNYPVEISMLWPPALEKENVIETNFRSLKMAVKGEADFSTYPLYRSKKILLSERGHLRLFDVYTNSVLQMVTSERYHRTLEFKYVRPLEQNSNYSEPMVDVFCDDNQPCEDVFFEDVPLRGVLHFCSTDDGHVDVYEGKEFKYRKAFSAGERMRITEIKNNYRLCVYVGLELLREITISTKKVEALLHQEENLPIWKGRMIPFPRRYGWVLGRILNGSELYNRTMNALKQGEIPLDGWNTIRMLMEEC